MPCGGCGKKTEAFVAKKANRVIVKPTTSVVRQNQPQNKALPIAQNQQTHSPPKVQPREFVITSKITRTQQRLEAIQNFEQNLKNLKK